VYSKKVYENSSKKQSFIWKQADEITWEWKKLHYEELLTLYPLINEETILMTGARDINNTGGERVKKYKNSVRSQRGARPIWGK
jgi:hypothetical protein